MPTCDASTTFLSIDMKRILRAVPVTDDAMFCVVVGQFNPPVAARPGLPALSRRRSGIPTGAPVPVLHHHGLYVHQRTCPGRTATTLPFTSPHESAHTLCDLIHTKPSTNHSRTELMARRHIGRKQQSPPASAFATAPTSSASIRMGPRRRSLHNVRLAEVLRTGGAAKMEAW